MANVQEVCKSEERYAEVWTSTPSTVDSTLIWNPNNGRKRIEHGRSWGVKGGSCWMIFGWLAPLLASRKRRLNKTQVPTSRIERSGCHRSIPLFQKIANRLQQTSPFKIRSQEEGDMEENCGIPSCAYRAMSAAGWSGSGCSPCSLLSVGKCFWQENNGLLCSSLSTGAIKIHCDLCRRLTNAWLLGSPGSADKNKKLDQKRNPAPMGTGTEMTQAETKLTKGVEIRKWQVLVSSSGTRKRNWLPIDSPMSLYLALESGKFWFPAQVYNCENGHVGFGMSCYDAKLRYDSQTNTFQARYPLRGRKAIAMETHIDWERVRAPPIDTPSHELHISDYLNDLCPGDHIEIRWRRNKESPYDPPIVESTRRFPQKYGCL